MDLGNGTTINMHEDNSNVGHAESMGIPEKLKLNSFLLAGACQSVAALHLDITPETIKPLKPVAVAQIKMGNEKNVSF